MGNGRRKDKIGRTQKYCKVYLFFILFSSKLILLQLFKCFVLLAEVYVQGAYIGRAHFSKKTSTRVRAVLDDWETSRNTPV